VAAAALERHDARTGRALLHSCDVAITSGSRIAVTGPSGSGKSVLLRTLAWLDAPDGGTLCWCGTPITRSTPTATITAYRSAVAYVRQRPALFDGSVEDNLRAPFALRAHRARRRYDAHRVATLLGAAGRGGDFTSRRAADLSGGETQLVALIRTLQLDPDVLLLDEPTAALDAASSAAVERLVETWFAAAPGRAFAWITHDPAQAQRVGRQHWQIEAGKVRTA
jgi:putative ABC transport system ATP-binding protein